MIECKNTSHTQTLNGLFSIETRNQRRIFIMGGSIVLSDASRIQPGISKASVSSGRGSTSADVQLLPELTLHQNLMGIVDGLLH